MIAYNNLFCVEYQIKAYRAFCRDDHKLIVVDSNCGAHAENSQAKRALCQRYGVECLELPAHLSYENANPSDILGHKITWVFHNIIKTRRPRYFGIIDQDFFPFRPFSVKEDLDRYGMYGDVSEMATAQTPEKDQGLAAVVEGPWVLHPWLSFYRYDLVCNVNMNWLPAPHFDTGGSNWAVFVEPGQFRKKDFWRRQNTIMYYPFDELLGGRGPPPYEKQYFPWRCRSVYGQVQIYDGHFVHMLNSKYLDDPANPKTNFCKGFLDAALLLEGSTPFTTENGFHNEGCGSSLS